MLKKKIISYSLFRAALMLFLFSFISVSLIPAAGPSLEKLYFEAEFEKIITLLAGTDFTKLALEEKLLFLECSARTGRSHNLLSLMEQLQKENPSSAQILTTAAIVQLSEGNFGRADELISQALVLEENNVKAKISRVMVHLFYQRYYEAEMLYDSVAQGNLKWGKTFFNFLVGVQLYNASRNIKKLAGLYKSFRKSLKNNPRYNMILKDNYNLYRKIRGPKLFTTELKFDFIEIPLEEFSQNSSHRTFFLEVNNRKFKVILDTGNAVGWIIHNWELSEMLKIKKGGRTSMVIGTESSKLDGYKMFTKTVDFNKFRIINLTGVYVPKPRREFYDANLNPVFIRDRVVTLDFINNKFILRTKQRFEEDLQKETNKQVCRLPCWGYKNVYIPISVNDKIQGVGMIESGAADISLKLDFARKLKLQLKPAVRYLSSGKVFRYYHTSLILKAEKFYFYRPRAEVWPLNRFTNRFSGISPDVIFGPKAFLGKISISFDPFEKKVILVGPYNKIY